MSAREKKPPRVSFLMKENPSMATRLHIFIYLPQWSLLCPLPMYVSFTASSHSGFLTLPETQQHTSFRSLFKGYFLKRPSPTTLGKMPHPSLYQQCFHNSYQWLTLCIYYLSSPTRTCSFRAGVFPPTPHCCILSALTDT